MKASIHQLIYKLMFLKNNLRIIDKEGINLFIQKILKKAFMKKKKRKILLTIDDGFIVFL